MGIALSIGAALAARTASLEAASLSVLDVAVPMGQCRAHTASFQIRLAGGAGQTVTVDYATADGSAVADADYTATSGTLTFRPGTRVRFVRVPVADVSAPGPKKTFFLNLTNAVNATLADGQAVATIRPPAFAKCDDGNACTQDSCETATRTCRHIDVARCGVPHAATLPLPPGSSCEASVCPIPDSDGDGLNDAWEAQGYVDFNCNGSYDGPSVDLPLPGASPTATDVYLQIDYMVKAGAGGHSHQPSPEAVQAVTDAFERQGVALHVDPTQHAIPESAVVTFDPLTPNCSGSDAVNFFDLKSAYSDPHRRLAYHYAVFGHYHTCDNGPHCSLCSPPVAFGSGGRAELPGNDLIVSLGAYQDFGLSIGIESEAGVLMHELGHNLGLQHGGGADLPDYKPNYLSVVNDAFTYTGIQVAAAVGSATPISCNGSADCPSGAICGTSSSYSGHTCVRIDYSGQALPSLDEANLDENAGISAGTADIATFQCPDFGAQAFGPGVGPIDWNCNGNATEPGVAADVTGDGLPSVLTGFDNWSAAQYGFQCTALGSANGPQRSGRQPREPGIAELLARGLLRTRVHHGARP